MAGIKDPFLRERALKRLQKERARSIAEDIFPKLVEQKGEMPVIKDQLPTIFHDGGAYPGRSPRGCQENAFARTENRWGTPIGRCWTDMRSGTPP